MTDRPAEAQRSRDDKTRSDRKDTTDKSTKSPLTERVQAALAGPGTSSAPGQPAAERGSTRTARLRLTRLDPWSVMKTSFLLSIAFGIVTVVAVAIVWGVLGAAGVWESINTSVQQIVGGDAESSFDVEDYLGAERILGFTVLIAVVDVILITAIATLSAFLYNLAAALLGGLEVTLAEDDR
ncbi:MAG: DUF3566 domain-containing protein [Nocardioides sp.]|nr:DUF3566 domain-containing protein [Nocardioides sp.]